jgi:hypothetical protein
MLYIELNMLKSQYNMANMVQRDGFIDLKFDLKHGFNDFKSARFLAPINF